MDQIIQSRRRPLDYIPPQKKKKKEKNDVKPCLNYYQLHFEMRQKNMEKLKQSLPDALNIDKYVGNPPRLISQPPPPPRPQPFTVVKGKLVKPVVVDKASDDDDNDKNDGGDVEFGDGGDGCGDDKKKNRKDVIEMNVEVDDGNSRRQSSSPCLVSEDCDSGVVVGAAGDDDPTEVDDDTQKYTKLFANSSASISQRELDLFAFSELLVPIVNSTQSATTFDNDDPLSLLLSSLSFSEEVSQPLFLNPIETILTQSVQGIGFVPATNESRQDFSRQVDQLLDQEYPPDYLTPVNPIPPKKKRKSKKKEISPEEQILAQRKREEKKLSAKSSVPRSNRKAAGLARAKFELMDKDDEEDESEIDEEFKMARSIEHHKLMTTVLMNNGLVAPPSRPSCSSSSSLSESKQKKKKKKKMRRS